MPCEAAEAISQFRSQVRRQIVPENLNRNCPAIAWLKRFPGRIVLTIRGQIRPGSGLMHFFRTQGKCWPVIHVQETLPVIYRRRQTAIKQLTDASDSVGGKAYYERIR